MKKGTLPVSILAVVITFVLVFFTFQAVKVDAVESEQLYQRVKSIEEGTIYAQSVSSYASSDGIAVGFEIGNDVGQFIQDKLSSGGYIESKEEESSAASSAATPLGANDYFDLAMVPEYSGEPYARINNGRPWFISSNLTTDAYEYYGDLDGLGRCTTAYACVGRELMPTEERGEIGMVHPSGWHTVKYPGIIDDLYLYNRCHLIMYALTGENANEKNLITGTRYLNVEGMLPFEDAVLDYIKNTGNHVLYRVTPVFNGQDLVCRGVLMEAYSVEDEGHGICFCAFCYNVQPGISIDYATGESVAL